MSGGGGRYSDIDTKKALQKLEEAKAQTQTAELTAQVSQIIDDILKECSTRDLQTIKDSSGEIKEVLGRETMDLLFGCATSAHPFADGLADIDLLVILDDCDLLDNNPAVIGDHLLQELKERFSNIRVDENGFAIEVTIGETKIRLLSAIRCKDEIYLPSGISADWINIKSTEFIEDLSKVNKDNEGLVAQLIKIAKGINSSLPEQQRLRSYHLESLAVKVFENYTGPKTIKAMLQNFFSEGARHVMERVKGSKSGQFINVDNYAGESGSAERRLISNALNRISRNMDNADKFNSLDEWNRLLR